VVGLHRHYVAAGLQLDHWTKSAKTPWTDVIMLPLPLFHVYGNLGVQPLAFLGPHPVSLVPNPRDLNDLLATIKQVKPAFFNGVPSLYTAILNHPKVREGQVDLRSIRICFSGAAALMAETKHRFEEKTGARIVEGYSLTEGMMACCVNPVQGRNKLGSIGMPLPDVEVQIVDAEEGQRPLAPGEIGELIMRAPQYMAEYWNNPLETSEALRLHADGRRWLHTGDLAYLDEDGYVFLVDRKKDLIKTSGFQVWPREIEEVLSAHPAVMEVGVAGRGRPARVLQGAARALQGARRGGVPKGLAENHGRQDPPAGAGGGACAGQRRSVLPIQGLNRGPVHERRDGGEGATVSWT
jgi:long-chain acyl-CoA synthetase